MEDTTFQKILPSAVYGGVVDVIPENATQLADVLNENQPTENNFVDHFADLVRKHGNIQVKQYAKMMGIEARLLMAAMVAITGMGARQWLCEYLRMVSCDLLERTDWPIGRVGKVLGFPSVSAFSQFFHRLQRLQPYEWRTQQQRGKGRSYHFSD